MSVSAYPPVYPERTVKGVDSLLRVTPSMLKQHNKRDDAWSAFNGKVYNITHYLPYHPGGEKELIRVAGRDGSKLFGQFNYHIRLPMFDARLNGACSADTCVGQPGIHAGLMSRWLPRSGIITLAYDAGCHDLHDSSHIQHLSCMLIYVELQFGRQYLMVYYGLPER